MARFKIGKKRCGKGVDKMLAIVNNSKLFKSYPKLSTAHRRDFCYYDGKNVMLFTYPQPLLLLNLN